jgi:hypothetical protein
MKLSVSLPDEDLAYIDEYASRTGTASRSAVLHHAVDLLRMSEMEQAYVSAWGDWHGDGDHDAWESTAADGLRDAAR